MVKLAQQLNRSTDSIKHICCYGIVLMWYNGIGVCFSADIYPQKLIKGTNVKCFNF